MYKTTHLKEITMLKNSLLKSASVYQNFIFDVGNVLLLWDPAEILRKALPNRKNPEQYAREIFDHEDWQKVDSGVLTNEEIVNLFSRKTGLSKKEIFHLLEVAKDSLTPIPEGFQLLNTLHLSGKKLYCLTNMATDTFLFLNKKYDFWKLFSGIVVSGDIKMIKPDARIFTHMISLYNLNPTETVFFDDNINNVKSAYHVGIQSILFTRDLARVAQDFEAIARSR